MTDDLTESDLSIVQEVKLDPETARLRVKLGAVLLDEKRPDWFRRVDRRWLRLESIRTCVLGQAYPESTPAPFWVSEGYGSRAEFVEKYPRMDPDQLVCTAHYDLGRYLLGLDDQQCEEHGFLVDPDRNPDGTYPNPFRAYRMLEAAWSELIEERLRDSS